jgi:predicted nucleic acid-binding protein
MYLLDTNIISFLFKDNIESENILHNFSKYNLTGYNAKIYISTITVQEIVYGIKLVRLQKGKDYKKEELDKSLKFINEASVIKIPFDQEMAIKTGEIKARLKNSGVSYGDDSDLMIAATAIECGFTLITNNTKHFQNIPGLEYEDWTVI